jgi:hypothetical protein
LSRRRDVGNLAGGVSFSLSGAVESTNKFVRVVAVATIVVVVMTGWGFSLSAFFILGAQE